METIITNYSEKLCFALKMSCIVAWYMVPLNGMIFIESVQQSRQIHVENMEFYGLFSNKRLE